MMDGVVDRRGFLDRSAKYTSSLAAGAALAFPKVSQSSGLSPREQGKVRIAVMGVNGRGRQLVTKFAQFPQVEVAYLCEPDFSVVDRSAKIVTQSGRKAPKIVKDFREALDDPDVDVLVCAAPDHWHALATILACQAGKDVYVEKPASHTLDEGRRMIDAARKYGRVVQVGTQRRSGADFQAAVQQIRDGRLGKVGMARAWSSKVRPDIGHCAVTPPPDKLDFDLWCGPGPNHGYQSNLVHYHWHWRWAYGTGEIGNLGVHSLDVARWGLGVDFPSTVSCGGGMYAFDDDKQTPDTQFATFDYADCTIQLEQRMWSNRGLEGKGNWGVIFYGTKATLVAESSGWKLYQGSKLIDSHDRFDCESAHVGNFLDCVVTRERPNADIEIGHCSASLAHLANIAFRTRSVIEFDPEAERILGNEAANALVSGKYRPGFELPVV